MMLKSILRNPIFFFPIAFIILALIPLSGLKPFYLKIFLEIFLFIAIAEAWNIIGGYGGYISLGNGAFFGIGGYVTAMLLYYYGFSPFTTAIIGGLIAMAVAMSIGLPILRLKGEYFIIVTLAIHLAVASFFLNFQAAGGGAGMILPNPMWGQFGASILYWAFLVIMAGTIVVVFKIEKSKFGYALFSIRENELAAGTMGVNATKIKVMAFGLSALLTGIVGGIYPYYTLYVLPQNNFALIYSMLPVLLCILGKRGSWLGPIVGSCILFPLRTYLSLTIGSVFWLAVMGGILVAVIVIMPRGVIGLVEDLASKKVRIIPKRGVRFARN